MQSVLERFFADGAVFRGEKFTRRAVFEVDGVNVVDELFDRLLGKIVGEPAAELRREVVLAVRA